VRGSEKSSGFRAIWSDSTSEQETHNLRWLTRDVAGARGRLD